MTRRPDITDDSRPGEPRGADIIPFRRPAAPAAPPAPDTADYEPPELPDDDGPSAA